MLRAMEVDRTVSQATQDALDYGDSHPRLNLYEMQPYKAWLRREQRSKRPSAERLEFALRPTEGSSSFLEKYAPGHAATA